MESLNIPFEEIDSEEDDYIELAKKSDKEQSLGIEATSKFIDSLGQ
jgi:hypothetical protein